MKKETIDYLNEKAKTNYRSNTKKVSSVVDARIAEGAILEDFKKAMIAQVKKMTQAQQDFITFVDGDSAVLYHETNASYFPKPTDEVTIESFELENKTFVKSMLGYYVSIITNDFVRNIKADDYYRVKKKFDLNLNLPGTKMKSKVNCMMFFLKDSLPSSFKMSWLYGNQFKT